MRLPFISPAYLNSPEFASGQGGARLVDGYIDERLVLRKRPGLSRWTDDLAGNGECQGVYYWEEKNLVVAVFSGLIYYSIGGSSALTLVGGGTLLNLNTPCSFSSNATWLVVTNGLQPVIWSGSGDAKAMSGDTRSVTHYSYLDCYFLFNEANTERTWYSEPYDQANPTAEPTMSGQFKASGRPDFIKALQVGWREAVLIGTKTTEIWYNTGDVDAPFRRMEGAFIERGTAAAYSVVLADNTWIWLADDRNVIGLEGRTPKVLSLPIFSHLQAMQRVDDAIGFIVDRFYVLSFPSEKRTFVLDLVTKAWAEWGYWMPDINDYHHYLGQFATFVPSRGLWLVGSRKSSNLLQFTSKCGKDDGNLIRMLYRTAPFDHGSSLHKGSSRLSMRVQARPITTPYAVKLPSGLRCAAYSYQLAQVSAYGINSWTWAASGLPAGLSFAASSRTVSGTPIAVGVFALEFTLTSADGFAFTVAGSITIADDLSNPLSITLPGD